MPLARPWNTHKPSYDYLIVGSGYGGAITAARLASAPANPKPSICILERGREWNPGDFPDTLPGYLAESRSSANPLGLYELLTYQQIGVLKGSGLGGTSLVNANVAFVPDEDAFRLPGWPQGITLPELLPYYGMARDVLAAGAHPRAAQLPKFQALQRRAVQVGTNAQPLDIAVNFSVNGNNRFGVAQKPCTDCGDCVTGCNVGAKNTLNMNYLPMAANAGAEIFTQTKVVSIEKLAGGGYKVYGVFVTPDFREQKFTIEAKNVILAAGAINSTEILLRSANLRGLPISPAVGTRFGGNGDFFGLSYNGDNFTQVLGFGNHPASPGAAVAPGPTIVAAIRYRRDAPAQDRFVIEDLSFPNAYVRGAQIAFAALPAEDTDAGDEAAERARKLLDLVGSNIYSKDGALNHTMFYLCMGTDASGGEFRWERPWNERDGRVSVQWPGAGDLPVFGIINEEIRRNARTEGAHFLPNPLWSFLGLRPDFLVTAHPLGGCPMGDDYASGAVDQFGRVFAADGVVHDGLFVADGSIVPNSLGVNPFLTISALAERIADHRIRNDYPAPPVQVGFSHLDPLTAPDMSQTELERIFDRTITLPVETMINSGVRTVDPATRTVFNDEFWKGFFPKDTVLNPLAAALFTGFKKRFFKKAGKIVGVTSDVDGVINANNSLELVDGGKSILLRYLDPPWQGFYDLFRVVNQDLLIGQAYMGTYPNGLLLFTFPMTRRYSYAQLTVADHRHLYETATVPTAAELEGAWRMDVVSNANQAPGLAYLTFSNKPDGRLEARFQVIGLFEGLMMPAVAKDHFQFNDFTPFHDEVRKLADDLLIGKWVSALPFGAGLDTMPLDLGIFHREPDGKFGFYYLLHKTTAAPELTILQPLLNQDLPRGVGLSFDEEMTGWFQEEAIPNSFRVRMTIRDLNDFLGQPAHESRLSGEVQFGAEIFQLDNSRSFFNYLRLNPATREAEMRYYLEYDGAEGKRFSLEGVKLMQKDSTGLQEVLQDYTTLFTTVFEHTAAGKQQVGKGVLKFKTFEDVAALGNLTAFLGSFRVTGTTDPALQLLARLKFIAFTAQFVQHEYEPLAP